MKIRQYIKRMATLALMVAILAPLQEAWGQVSEDKYITYNSVGKDGTVTANVNPEGAANIFDGNDDSYWIANDHKDVVIFTFRFNSDKTFDAIKIWGGGQESERPVSIRFISDSFTKSFDQLDISVRELTLDLGLEITTSSFKLEFVSQEQAVAKIALNEVTLLLTKGSIIQHKPAKWFDMVEDLGLPNNSLGTFSHDEPWFTSIMSNNPDAKLQAAHTYIDTIYVHKGSTVNLSLPTQMGNNYSIHTYQRWYSYRTDGTFETNHSSGSAYDLLTPTTSGSAYRLSNGYVGNPLGGKMTSMNFYYPEDEEFKKWFDNAASFDNDWYVVACDVSGYTDFWAEYPGEQSDNVVEDATLSKRFVDNGYYEPTLSLRAVFYIVGVDEHTSTDKWEYGHNRLTDETYQGGVITGDKKYLEEYDITFPAKHLSNHTSELVALSKDARGYAIPDISENENLSIKIVENSAGLQLETTSLSGANRIIKFRKQGVGTNTPWEVADGSSATILVTKKVGAIIYNIARFNLKFVAETLPLTQTQVSQLGTDAAAGKSWNYTYRSPQWMEDNLKLLTSQNFDYDPNVAAKYGQGEYFPFPMSWAHSSYAFFDGSKKGDFKGATQQNGQYFAEWGYYAIVNDYMGYGELSGGITARPPEGVGKDDDGYFLFIDTSDRPGVIAQLPFDERLCPGSELFMTAWIKSSGNASNDDAAVLFTIFGVNNNTDGTVTHTPIYRHSSSQIRTTALLNSGDPGTGSGHNEWFQVYFSFINNDSQAANYDSYVLQIENNSASTEGGDMYIDDIRVYLMQPSAEVSQLNATCTNERTLMNIKLDWERLLSRLGYTDSDSGEDAIDFCFIDEIQYNNYLTEHPGDYADAIGASVVEVGNNEDPAQGGYNGVYHTLYFKLPFNNNTVYNTNQHPNLAVDNGANGKYFFYQTTDNAGIRSLVVDFYSALTPNRPYIMLINTHNPNDDQLDQEDFANFINDACAIKTNFYVTSETLLRVNGEVVNPSTDFCAGQIFNFSAQMRVPVSEEDGTESYIVIDKGVYFDWFFGSEEEFTKPNPNYENESLQSALVAFREIQDFVDKEDLTGVEAGDYTDIDGLKVTLTEAQIGIISHYLNESGTEGGLHRRLVLHKENLDITLLQSGLQLVIQPIRTLVPPADDGIDEDLWANVCWSYIPLVLTTSGNAPQLHAGFNYVMYPTEDFNPGLRIGLDQIKSTSETYPLVVNLRGAEVVTDGAKSIGMITSVTPEIFNKIYLVGTDDPEYNNDTYFPVDFGQYSLPIGTLKSLSAEPYVEGSDYNDIMEIYFDANNTDVNGFNFEPKEGYTYTFAVHFEEKMDDSDDDVSNACFGSFTVDMKVVPEYLVWNDVQKDDPSQPEDVTIGNWNYDGNWKRIASTDINAATNNVSDYFTDGSNQTDNGFVPMLFSKVIIPENSKVELYAAGASGANWISYRPSHIAAISDSIQYDLMAFDHPSNDQTFPGQLKTERYRVSLLNQIHFEPGAEMLHAEYLLYKKAWVDYQLGKGRWYTLASPLKAVVAGDFYTDSDDGVEKQEYFTDITFTGNGLYNNDNLLNNRFNPSVYQRAWKGESTEVPLYTDATTTKNVAISGNWSALTNDVAEKYEPGTGFSLKVQDVTDNATFRLPKADTEYYYYSQGETNPGEDDKVDNISKENTHRLQSDEIYQRTDNSTVGSIQVKKFTVPLGESADGQYYLVGNPFMAHLDMAKFFAENSNLESKYWVVDNNSQTVAVGKEEDLTTTNSTGDATVAPLQSFFVQKVDNATRDQITFTQDMQTLGGTGDGLRSANALTITATTTDGRTSRAAVAYSGMASDDYQSSEDAELFLDSNLGDVPMVYTVAGTMASSINVRQNCELVPLGVYGARNEQVTLRFDQVGVFSGVKLYDTKTKRYTTLTDGSEVSVSTNDYGRYYLTGGIATGNEAIRSVDDISIYSVRSGEIVATSAGSRLRSVRVYGIGGELVTQQSLANQSVYRLRVPGNTIYVVYAEDEDGIIRNVKLRVR